MGARIILIGLIIVAGIIFLGIILGMYFYLKRPGASGKPLMEEAVNKQTNTTKMGLGEFSVYAFAILVALVCGIKLMDWIGSGGSPVATAILLPPVMALFNARKRTGKSLFGVMVVAIAFLYMFLVYIIIGVPVKAPVFAINDTKIIMAQTRVADVIAEGFDIYVRGRNSSARNYDELLSSGDFEKYPADKSVFVEKGFRRNNDSIYYSPYLLVKDGVVIGSIGLYGDKTKDTVLEDCKIIQFKLDEDCTAAARANAISYRLDDVELFVPLKQETLQKTFGDKLWLVPPHKPIDRTELHYGIKWSCHSDHLFWNEYFSYIHFDESDSMTGFELSTQIARDSNE